MDRRVGDRAPPFRAQTSDGTTVSLAHQGRAASTSYGVLRRLAPVAKRVAFIVDPNGKVAARLDHELQVSRHLGDVVRFLRTAMETPPK